MKIFTSSFDEALETIKEEYERIKNSEEKALKLVQNYNKDDEIAKREEQIDSLYKHSLLIMSDRELDAHNKFIKKHYEMHNNGKFKCGGETYLYKLTGTGLGTVIKIKCPICGEEEDITDIDSW